MADDDKPRGFWTSLPGVLTALAGVITATAGLVVALKPSALTTPSNPAPQVTPEKNRPEAKADSADTVEILSVAPSPIQPLTVGQDVEFTIRARYRLQSRPEAVLALYLEEFPETDAACTGPVHQSNGGKLVSISQGTSELQVSVRWQRTVLPGPKDRIPGGRGHLSVGSNLWASKDRQPGTLITRFGTFPSYCRPYRADPETAKS
jgi:hypothetical protein